MSKKLRIGLVSYLNTYPVYFAIEKGIIDIGENVEIIRAVPTVLNRMLKEGELDISVVSSFEYALHFEDYFILPQLCIGADGEVKSVLFFSKEKAEMLEGKKIYLTEASLTSKTLTLYFFKKIGVKPKIHEFQFQEGIPENEYQGILLIGDEALKAKKRMNFKYIYDLATVWKRFFNLPFVFALWCVRKESYKKNREAVLSAWKALLTSKEIGKQNFESIASEKAKELGLEFGECLEYLKVLHFDLGKNYIKGLKKFFEEAYKEGFLHELPELNFIED